MTQRRYRLDGARVRRLRQKLALGRTGFLELMQAKAGRAISMETLYQIERGQRPNGKPTEVSETTYCLVAAALGVHPDQLVQSDGQPAEPSRIPMGLENHLCTFDALIEDKTEGFVGRDFVFDAVRDFQSAVPSGYYLIRGEPGIGKSALIAKLVQREDCVHHFNIAAQGITTTRIFLRNVCAQLIVRYGLSYEKLPDDLSENGLFFSELLREVKQRLKSGSKLLLAIDALDEVSLVRHPANANLLFLPPSLPEGVHIVLTTKPLHDLRLQVTRPISPLELERNNEGQIADVRAYVESHCSKEGVRAWIKARELDEQRFIEFMLEKSERNFMYLRHVLDAMAKGQFHTFSTEDLPKGLIGYYRTHWARMMNRDTKTFEDYYQPVVCVLAAAKEALAVDEIAEAVGFQHERVLGVIHAWREFLYEERREDGRPCYRLYHGSFQDFLREEVGLKDYHNMLGMTVLKRSKKFTRHE